MYIHIYTIVCKKFWLQTISKDLWGILVHQELGPLPESLEELNWLLRSLGF